MTGDPQFTNIPLLSTFLKHFSRAYLGEPSSKVEDGNTNSDTSPGEELIPSTVQAAFKEMFIGYFNSASKTLVKGQIVSCSLDQSHAAHAARRNFSSKINVIMRRTSSRERYSKTVNMHMSE
jgi:regulator of nonsense transcripts 2